MAHAEFTATAVNTTAPHAHKHGRVSDSRRRLTLVLVLTAIYMVAEVVGGWWTGSLALLADAGHMLTDVAALALAFIAAWFGNRPATSKKTFGSHRLEIPALVNGVALIVISLLIFTRLIVWSHHPRPRQHCDTWAAGGLIIN